METNFLHEHFLTSDGDHHNKKNPFRHFLLKIFPCFLYNPLTLTWTLALTSTFPQPTHPHLILLPHPTSGFCFKLPPIQIDNFLGANFFHLRGVLEKLSPNLETVILAAGLNNCLAQQTAVTTWKQLQQLQRTREIKFPHPINQLLRSINLTTISVEKT